MFDSLSSRLSLTLKKLQGQARLTPENMKETLREIRRALLEADVGLPVIKSFLTNIENQYEGQEVAQKLSPGQQLIKIIQQELINLLGEKQEPINLSIEPPALILLSGLQGVGKTTSAAKLAKKLKEQKKRVLLTSCDVYRPAAIEQLKILAKQIDVEFFSSDSKEPIEIAKQAKQYATQYLFDALIVDTAGRLNIDEQMMTEISKLQQLLSPIETLFVADSQQGQDAVNVAEAFAKKITITGLVFTKVDGDSRGGAILSVRHIVGQPIKLISVGEKLEDIQDFHPDRIASRILGMGDMLSLIEELEQKTSTEKATKTVKKINKGGALNFNDLLTQLQEIGKMGGIQSMLDKLPGMGNLGAQMANPSMDDKAIKRQIAIIQSMTPKERANPEILKGSRRRRIAAGAGQSVQNVNQLIKQQKEMKGMMKRFKNKNFRRQMGSLMQNKF
jgi:signal recognition particle subunit SRP54